MQVRKPTYVYGKGYPYHCTLEYCVAPYQVVKRIPETVNMTEAAGLCEFIPAI